MNLRDVVAIACVIVFAALVLAVAIMYALRSIKQRRAAALANFTSTITFTHHDAAMPRHRLDELPPAALAPTSGSGSGSGSSVYPT